MRYDAIIVGGGIAGLTSAAFLSKEGYKVLLLEKEKQVGGLVNSFTVDGFLYDAGARGIVDSGIVKPMLKALDLQVDFQKSIVTIGIEDAFVKVENLESLKAYRNLLAKLYPESEKDIDEIMKRIRQVMDYMDVLYGIENPLFKDLKKDREYLLKTLMPWTVRFLRKARKIKSYNQPVYDYLDAITENQSLVDIISQHFFQETPASFALSYFSLYLDYEYPLGGTGQLAERMRARILESGGRIETESEVRKIHVDSRTLLDQKGRTHAYEQLIWAADQTKLYEAVDMNKVGKDEVKGRIEERKSLLEGKRGGDSIYSMFLAVDLHQDFFRRRSTGHMFYTPRKEGQSQVFSGLQEIRASKKKEEILEWMNDYLEYTTYEIAIPSLRDPRLAPEGKTGLIISVLMDYDFIRNIRDLGFYEAFKDFSEKKILDVLDQHLYKGIKDAMIHRFSSTPLTIERLSGNHDGGITGWAFTNDGIPSVSEMTKITQSVLTPIPDVLQAGQWTYSPSGVPISILTGKIAADRASKALTKGRKR